MNHFWPVLVEHTEGDWLRIVEREFEFIEFKESIVIDPKDVSCAIPTAHNRKTPDRT